MTTERRYGIRVLYTAVFSLLFLSAHLRAEDRVPIALPDAAGMRVETIEIEGLSRTREIVVRRELLFHEGAIVSLETIRESIARIKNLEIFRIVEFHFFKREPGPDQTALVIKVEERWTTIPYFSIRGGGGTTAYQAGLFDVNVAGRLNEAGAQYENLNGTHGGWVWYRNPRLADQHTRLGVDLAAQVRNRDLYRTSGQREGAFTIFRKRTHVFVDHELHRSWTVGGGADLTWDQVNESKIAPSYRDTNTSNGYRFSSRSKARLFELFTEFGHVDTDIYLYRGFEVRLTLQKSFEFLGSSHEFYRTLLVGRWYIRLPLRANIALQMRTGQTSAPEVQDLFYLGGFDTVRGYPDGILRTKGFLQANAEFRIPSLRTPWLVLQHVAFVDLARGSPFLRENTQGDRQDFGSVGAGFRLISPKIYSFNGRLDFAYGLGPAGGWGIAFGSQQFF